MSYKVSEISIVYKPKKGKRPQITESIHAFHVLLDIYDWNTIEYQETFWVLFLNRSNRVIGAHKLSVGGRNGTVVDARILFTVALKANAVAIILSHNHPSNCKDPSKADIALTQKLKKAGETLDIQVLDHLIITTEGYTSMADSGYI